MPLLSVKAPETESVPVVAANVPPVNANGPFTVNAAVPPTKAPPAWLQPVAPTVAAIPAAWLMVPPYASATDTPPTFTAAFMIAFLLLVPSNDAMSPAPGTPPDQLAASLQLFVRPSPVHVRVAALVGCTASKATQIAAVPSSSLTIRRGTPRFRPAEELI